MELNRIYLDNIPVELKALIQLYVNEEDLDNWYQIIGIPDEKLYWTCFYSLFLSDFRLIINDKKNDDSYLDQYKYLLNVENIINQINSHRFDGVVYLISKGTDVNTKDDDGYPIIVLSGMLGDINIFKYLIKYGANVGYQNNNRNNILIWASLHDRTEIVKYLVLEHNFDINHQNINGDTALINISMCCDLDMVGFLVTHGGDLRHKNIRGNSALSILSDIWDQSLIDELLDLEKK